MLSGIPAKARGLKRPSPALIVAVLALVAALAGTAIAADPLASTSAKKVTKKKVRKIANKQIDKRLPLGTDDIGDGAVTSPKIARGAVGRGKIEDAAVTGPKINNGAVGGNKLDVSSAKSALGLHFSGRRELNPADGSSATTTLFQAGGVTLRGLCEDIGAENAASIQVTGPTGGVVHFLFFISAVPDSDVVGLSGVPATLVSTGLDSGPASAQVDGWATTASAAVALTAVAEINRQGDDCAFAASGRS